MADFSTMGQKNWVVKKNDGEDDGSVITVITPKRNVR